MLVLEGGGYEIAISPRNGAQLHRLTFESRPVLRTVSSDNTDPLSASCFPLIPFSNRLLNGQFEIGGATRKVASNWDGDEHAIHGEGWLADWDVLHSNAASCLLGFAGGANWPWRYRGEQAIWASPSGVYLWLRITNLSDTEMPAGLGFHPYFERFDDTRLQFQADRIRAPIEAGLTPITGLEPDFDFSGGGSPSARFIDHCYGGWDGAASIQQPSRGLSIKVAALSSAKWCVVYCPEREDFFCFEPVSHVNGALYDPDNKSNGLVWLKPNEEFSFGMRVSAERLD